MSNSSKVGSKTPANLDVERAVLGSMMLDNENAVRSFSVLSGEEFFLDSHQVTYRTMQSIAGEGNPIDLISLIDELGKQKNLERAGGAPYVSSLVDGVPRKSNIEHYAKIIRDAFRMRKLLKFHDEMLGKISSKGSVDDLVEESIQRILEISSTGGGGPLVRKWIDVAQSAVRKLDKERTDVSARIECGLTELDETTSGLRKQELVVIVGPTSNGKTLLAQSYAIHAGEQGYRGIIFSAEMAGEQLALRQLAPQAHVPMWKIRKPEYLTDEEFGRLEEASREMRPLVIVEKGISPANIWAISEAAKRSKGLDFVVVDYDQLVIETGIDPDDEEGFFRHQRKFVIEAKKFAERLDVCFILLSQLRKVSHKIAQGGKPTIDDIYGDSSIRNTPDVIIWVVRDFFTHGFKKEFENKVTVYIVKARNDRVGVIKLGFDSVYVFLKDPDPTEKDSVEESSRSVKPKGSIAIVPTPPQTSFTLED